MKPNDIWGKAKSEIRELLVKYAKLGPSRGMVSYSELFAQVRTIDFDLSHSEQRNCIAKMLGEISSFEAKAGRGMLSAIVVHKNGDKIPGGGFFPLAKTLGRDISNRDKCWIDELHTVYAYWVMHRNEI